MEGEISLQCLTAVYNWKENWCRARPDSENMNVFYRQKSPLGSFLTLQYTNSPLARSWREWYFGADYSSTAPNIGSLSRIGGGIVCCIMNKVNLNPWLELEFWLWPPQPPDCINKIGRSLQGTGNCVPLAGSDKCWQSKGKKTGIICPNIMHHLLLGIWISKFLRPQNKYVMLRGSAYARVIGKSKWCF